MGNRAYFTVKSEFSVPQTYYIHWNGGMDTIAPLCKALFDNNITYLEHALGFIRSLDIKPELQNHDDAITWLEENGHYFIDLEKQTLEHQAENQTVKQWIPHLKEAFDSYNSTKIKKEYRERHAVEYWDGILSEAEKFFRGSK